MNDTRHHEPSIGTPSPGCGRPNPPGIWVGLFGAPLAWIAQVSLSEPLAAHACYPYQTPLSEPIWIELPAILAAIGIVCLTAALLSGFRVWNLWRRSGVKPDGESKPMQSGNEGRDRFLLSLAAMSSFLFTLAIVFNLCALWLVPPCSPWF